MKIALCDDEKSYHGKILELIGQYRETKPGSTLLLSSFYSGKDLLNHVDEYGGFDLYILDCIMPGMDGIELGAALRRRDDHGMLIYLTTSPDFALDSYRVDAFDYLLKPVDKELFFRILDKAFNDFSRARKEMFSVKTPDSIRILPIADIRYAERTGKQICYYMADDTIITSISFNGSFKDAVGDLLSYKGMLLVGASFVVNLAHVTQITKTEMLLTGKLHVPIPRRAHDSGRKEGATFWLSGGKHHAI